MAPMTPPTRCVLDASSLLSYVLNKPGADAVAELLEHSAMHAATWTEMLTQLSRRADVHQPDVVAARLKKVIFIDVGQDQDAEIAGKLAALGPQSGLSLGDRYALAMAARLDVPVITAHSHWEALKLDLLPQTVRVHRVRST